MSAIEARCMHGTPIALVCSRCANEYLAETNALAPHGQASANQTQVGGAHYQMPIQTWDYIAANGIGYFEGNIIKYVSRWQKKGGVEDLKKARHYLDKLIELNSKEKP